MSLDDQADEVRVPGVEAGLISGFPGRKSNDQRMPSGRANARSLPPKTQILLQTDGQHDAGDRAVKSGGLATAASNFFSSISERTAAGSARRLTSNP
jgi:hypothetical protein